MVGRRIIAFISDLLAVPDNRLKIERKQSNVHGANGDFEPSFREPVMGTGGR